MFELSNGLILYHGSYCEVKNPNLLKCAKRKDFGQGFYLTTSKTQAESFLRTSLIKAKAVGEIEETQTFGYISTYRVELTEKLVIHKFADANIDWLHCITAHRKKQLFSEVKMEMAKFDVIIGKIADDATNTTLTAYLGGAFGPVGSLEADEFCINRLLPNRLKDQYCFKSDTALRCLRFIEGEKIWMK